MRNAIATAKTTTTETTMFSRTNTDRTTPNRNDLSTLRAIAAGATTTEELANALGLGVAAARRRARQLEKLGLVCVEKGWGQNPGHRVL